MNRRGFLGVIAGVLAGSKLLSKAKATPPPETKLEPRFYAINKKALDLIPEKDTVRFSGIKVNHIAPMDGPLFPEQITLRNGVGRTLAPGDLVAMHNIHPGDALNWADGTDMRCAAFAMETLRPGEIGLFAIGGCYSVRVRS